jgi:uncharacterized protein
MSKNSLSHIAISGATLSVRVTPKASRNDVVLADQGIKVFVTAPASDGQANKAVTQLLARALGVAKSRLTLVQGHKSRDKLFRLD